MKLLLIDNRVREIDIIKKSLETDVVSIIFDYENETIEGLKSKIPINQYESVGILQDQDDIPTYTLAKKMGDYDLNDYTTWTTYIELIDWVTKNLGIKFWDLIECNIDETWDNIISSLKNQFNITIRSSSKQLGNTNLGDNWVFDDGTSLIGIYFTTDINEYPYTLGTGWQNYLETFIDNIGNAWVKPTYVNDTQTPNTTGATFITAINGYGTLGQGNTNQYKSNQYILIPLPYKCKKITQVDGGLIFLLISGSCYACGNNSNFRLGLPLKATPTDVTYSTPTQITFSGLSQNETIDDITSGKTYTIFKTSSGNLYCCGTDNNSGIPVPNPTSDNALTKSDITGVYAVSAFWSTTIIVKTLDKTKIYLYGKDGGENNWYTINNNSYTVTRQRIITTTTTISKIECGGPSLYYIDTANNLWGYGWNHCGQLGQGTSTLSNNTTYLNSFTKIRAQTVSAGQTTYPLDTKVSAISSSYLSLQIITTDNKLYICGYIPYLQGGYSSSNIDATYSSPSTLQNYTGFPTEIPGVIVSVTSAYPYFSSTLLFIQDQTTYTYLPKVSSIFKVNNNFKTITNFTSPNYITNEIGVNDQFRSLAIITNDKKTYFIGKLPSNSTYTKFELDTTYNSVNNSTFITFTNGGFLYNNVVNTNEPNIKAYGYNYYGELNGTLYTDTRLANTIQYGNNSPITANSYNKFNGYDYSYSYTFKISSCLNHTIVIYDIVSKRAGNPDVYVYNQAVYVNGLNNYGQLGNGTKNTTTNNNISITFANTIKSICCGLLSSYFLDNIGNLYVCGYNGNNELGIDIQTQTNYSLYSAPPYNYIHTPRPVSGTYSQIACGYSHAIVLKSDGKCYVCGSNDYNQLGLSSATSNSYTILKNVDTVDTSTILYNVRFKYIYAGENRSAGITSTGWLYTWGRDISATPILTDKNVTSVYQVTDIGIIYVKNKIYYVAYPTNISPYIDFSSYLTITNNTAIIKDNISSPNTGNIQAYNNKINALNNCINTYLDFSGNVWVKPFIGINNSSTGILGQGNFTNPTTYDILQIATISDIVQTQQIGDGQIFLKRDGKCYACGLNTNYKLGLPGLDVAYATPTEILFPAGVTSPVKYISCGYSHSMFLLKNGDLYVCGTSGYGATMLRDDSDCSGNTLTKVAENVYLVSCNRDTTMIVKTTNLTEILLYGVDGRYTDWSTTSTTLGKTTNTASEANIPSKDSIVKLQSTNTKKINQIICGGPTFYYIDEDNNLWGAGFNNCGQLGKGTNTTTGTGDISIKSGFVNIVGYLIYGVNQVSNPLYKNVLTVSSAYVTLQILTLTGDLYICGLNPWASTLAFNTNNSDFNFDGVASGDANGVYYKDTPVIVATNVTDVYSNIISNNGSNGQYVECVYVTTTQTTGSVTSRVYKKIISGTHTILDRPTTAGTTSPTTNITPITSTNIINFKRNITLIDGERKIQCIGDFSSNNANATDKTKFSINTILNGSSGIDTDTNNIYNIHSLIDGFVCYIQEKNNYNTIKIKTFINSETKTYDTPSYLTSGLNHFFYIDSSVSAAYGLWSVGLNNYGQAGTGPGTKSDIKSTTSSAIQLIDNLKGIGKLKSACCGLFSSYFLDNSGNLYVCGYNFNNELGSSFETTSISPTDVSNNLFLLDIVRVKQAFTGTITQVACGYNHSILIITTVTGTNAVNTVWTCGLNNYGQLGQGNNNIVTTYTKIQITNGGNTTDISFNSIYAGENRCAGITSDNKLYTWGRDISNSPVLQDSNVSAVYKVTDIGIFYIKPDLKYYVSNVKIGNNLVSGVIQDNSTPAKDIYSYNKLNNLNNCIQTYLDIDGYAWVQPLTGNTNTTTGILGQLNNTQDITGTFKKVKLTANPDTFLSDIIQTQQVDGGQLFLKRDGTCWACGNNADYRLGLKLNQTYSTPTQITFESAVPVPADTNIKYISCGYSYSMFLFFNGDLYVCGKSGYGATALPTRVGDITENTLKRVATGVKFVSCSRDTTMIVLSNDLKTVYIYGIDGTDKDWKTKTKATDIFTATTVNSNKSLSLALDIKKIVCGGPSIYCIDVSYNLWGAGFNNCGQLGQSNTTSIVTNWTKIRGTSASSVYPLDTNVLTISSSYVSLQIVTLTGKLYICGLNPWTTTEIFKSFINTGDFDGLPKDSSTNCLFTPTEVTAENPTSTDTIIHTHITDVYSNIISYNNTTRYVGFYYVTHKTGNSKYKTLTSTSASVELIGIELIKTKKYSIPLLDNENKIWVLGEKGDDMYGTNTFTNTNQLTYDLKSTNKIKNTIRGIVLYDTNQQINTIGTSLYGEKTSGTYTMSDYDTNLFHSLYVSNTYEVFSIGLNNYGQLGTGNIENYIDINSLSYNYKSSLFLLNNSVNSKLSYFTGKNIIKVCCGLYTSYFLSNTNFLYACGYNVNSEFGKTSWSTIDAKIVNTLSNNYELTPVILPFNCSNIVCGDNHSIVVKSTDKTIWCCGLNTSGQLGLGNTNTYTNYQQLSLPANVTSFDYLYAGENRSAGITSDDKLYTWGKNISNRPVLQDSNVSAVYKVTDIGIIYIKNNKYYVANQSDILSTYSNSTYITYTTTTPQAPNPIIPYDNSILKLTNFIKTYINKAGIPYVVPLDGVNNTTGILGQLDTSPKTNDIFLTVVLSANNELSDIVQTQQVFGGQIFLGRDGTCYACGSNRYNSLGLGLGLANLNINTPTKISFPSSTPLVKYISCAGNRSMFLLVNGDVYVCGKGGNGESTLANTSDSNSNTMTKTLSNIFLIGCSVYKTYFVKADELKKIYYCGYGFYLVDNTSLSTPTNIKSIEIGVDSIYYIDEDNNLYGYGKNNCGQLGTGDTTDKTEWTRIRGTVTDSKGILDNNVLKISSAFITLQIVTLNGELYICGLKPDNNSINTFSSSIYNTPISANDYITTPTKIETITNVTNVYSNIIKFVSNTSNNYVSCVYVSDSKYKVLGFSQNTSLILNNPILNLKYNLTDIIPIANPNIINFNRNINLINTNGDIYSLGKGKFINSELIAYSSFTKNDYLSKRSIINIYSLLDGFIAFLNTNTIITYNSNRTIESTGTYLSTGINHSFIYKNDVLNVIGLNNYSQLADGTITDISTLTSNATLTNIKSACCGLHTSYFLKNSGELYVCGYNFNNELGINFKPLSGTTIVANYLYIKSLVKIDGKYSQVVCGYNHSIIVKVDDETQTQTILSCGLNNYGQLGLGNTNIYSEYTQIINKPTFTYLFAGENRSAGLTSTGWLYCWGRNIGSSPVLTDKNVQNVYLITDIGIIYIKNRQYYVAYPTDILSNVSNPIPNIIPYDKSSLPLTIYSNICFLEGTQVKCDQGLIEIDKINPNIHTISNKKIVAITETYSTEKELALIEKDSIRPNVPNKTTPITLEHKIYYKGKMIEAGKITKNRQKYNGERLYNVLMEEHNKMSVNNMIVETLDPANSIGNAFKWLRENNL